MNRFEKQLKAIEIDVARQSDDNIIEIRIQIIDPQTKQVCGLHQIQVGHPGKERFYKKGEIPAELLPKQGVRYEEL